MIKAIVTDIEGTTTDIDFVLRVLFPHARQHLPTFVQQNVSDPAVTAVLNAVRVEINQPDASTDDVVAALIGWIDADKKIKPLKDLQGMIWKSGYETRAFTGHVYQDAYDKLREWHSAGIPLYVYSSGSVAAQKLLFGYSDFGDMTPLFSSYFDTAVGGKKEAQSYQKIAAEIALPPAEILFLSDIADELDAARAAGMQTTGLNRKGKLLNANGHKIVTEFSEINLGGVRHDSRVKTGHANGL